MSLDERRDLKRALSQRNPKSIQELLGDELLEASMDRSVNNDASLQMDFEERESVNATPTLK